MDAKKPSLTPKQRRFVEEYAASDGNAVQAYFRAFGRKNKDGKKRSYVGASVAATRLLKDASIAAELQAAQEAYAKAMRVSKMRSLRELAALAFADPDDLYEPDPDSNGLPRPRSWADIPAAARKAIASVKVKRKRLRAGKDKTEWEVEEVEYRLHSKTEALDKLCRKLGFYANAGDAGEKAPAPLVIGGDADPGAL